MENWLEKLAGIKRHGRLMEAMQKALIGENLAKFHKLQGPVITAANKGIRSTYNRVAAERFPSMRHLGNIQERTTFDKFRKAQERITSLEKRKPATVAGFQALAEPTASKIDSSFNAFEELLKKNPR